MINPQDFGRVAVLLGGLSAEREISLMSGRAVLDSLTRQGIEAFEIDVDHNIAERLAEEKIDRAFIALHGGWGENGGIQALLDMMQIPYTGSGMLSCAIAMDKYRTKQIWQSCQLPTPAFRLIQSREAIGQALVNLGSPLAIKPAEEGSSFGVSCVSSAEEVEQAWQTLQDFAQPYLAERWIKGEEYTVGIIGERILPVIRIQTTSTFYDYAAKYTADDTQFHLPSGLTDHEESAMQELAFEAYKALGCCGWGRVDLMRDEQGRNWLIEINTIPGLTPDHSLVPMAARAAGLAYPDLVWEILSLTL